MIALRTFLTGLLTHPVFILAAIAAKRSSQYGMV